MSGFNRLIKNSISNIINGFSNVILGIVVSPFILNNLTLEQFSVWSLILQFGLFISFLGFGAQIAVGRFTSLAKFNNDYALFRNTMSNSLVICFLSMSIAFFAIVCAVINFDFFIPLTKNDGSLEYEISFIVVCVSFTLGLLSSIFSGYFTGIERNDIIATINLFSRVFLGFAIILSSRYGLLPMAVSYFVVNFISYTIIFLEFKKREKSRIILKISDGMKALLSFCGGLAIWNLAQFFISGTGAFIVGKYDFQNLAYYILALTLINAVVGIAGAIINPIIQPVVKLNAKGLHNEVDNLVVKLSLLLSVLIFVGLNISHNVSEFVLNLWVGADKAGPTNQIFNFLLAAFSIRIVVSPYGMKLVAEGKQLRISHYPLLEGIINLLLSIFFVKEFGAIGIAYSTMCSALLLMIAYAYKFSSESALRYSMVKISMPFFIIPMLSLSSVFFLGYFPMSEMVLFSQLLSLIPAVFILRRIMYDIRRIINII